MRTHALARTLMFWLSTVLALLPKEHSNSLRAEFDCDAASARARCVGSCFWGLSHLPWSLRRHRWSACSRRRCSPRHAPLSQHEYRMANETIPTSRTPRAEYGDDHRIFTLLRHLHGRCALLENIHLQYEYCQPPAFSNIDISLVVSKGLLVIDQLADLWFQPL